MARKNILAPTRVEASHSLTTSFNSTPTMVTYTDNVSYQINVTTSNSTGTFTVQVSDDYVPATPNTSEVAGNWAALTLGGGTPTVAAANDVIVINLCQLPFNAIRLAYTAGTAGTGTAEVIIMTKQIGG